MWMFLGDGWGLVLNFGNAAMCGATVGVAVIKRRRHAARQPGGGEDGCRRIEVPLHPRRRGSRALATTDRPLETGLLRAPATGRIRVYASVSYSASQRGRLVPSKSDRKRERPQ